MPTNRVIHRFAKETEGTKVHKLYIPKSAYKVIGSFAIAAAAAIGLTGCSASTPQVASTPLPELTVVTHDSFVISDELLAEFKNETGITVKLVKAGDTGALTNKLVLTKDSPIGDAVFGIDNTFAGVATANGVIDGSLSAVDFGDVCMNYDKAWFAAKGKPAPTSINQLITPAYRGLTVIENPNTSSTGLAFLVATVDKYGESGWGNYWKSLKANGVKVDAGWEDAYYTDFSGSSGKGAYPIVLSYASSPAYEVRANGESATASILDGCFRQTEYAGVLAKSKNPAGAKLFIDFLLSDKFQESIPESMYMYPINTEIELPADWAKWAQVSSEPYGTKLDVDANRKSWLAAWSAIFG